MPYVPKPKYRGAMVSIAGVPGKWYVTRLDRTRDSDGAIRGYVPVDTRTFRTKIEAAHAAIQFAPSIGAIVSRTIIDLFPKNEEEEGPKHFKIGKVVRPDNNAVEAYTPPPALVPLFDEIRESPAKMQKLAFRRHIEYGDPLDILTGLRAVWFRMFELNEAAPVSDKLTDEELSEIAALLFGHTLASKYYKNAARFRVLYERARAYEIAHPPANPPDDYAPPPQSYRYMIIARPIEPGGPPVPMLYRVNARGAPIENLSGMTGYVKSRYTRYDGSALWKPETFKVSGPPRKPPEKPKPAPIQGPVGPDPVPENPYGETQADIFDAMDEF